MFLIYSFLLTVGFVALLPRFVYDAFRRGKYVSGFSERLGNLTPLKQNGQPVIWLHCVSVGETQAARPLVQHLLEQFPTHRIVVSTITLTGQKLAREVFKNSAAKVFYFPFDWSFTTRRSLSRINPAAVLLMETEIWPGFIRSCRRRSIPVVIINGRLSERSYRRYKLVRPFISRVLSMVSLAVMQAHADAERITKLGMAEEKVFNAGNLKFDVGTSSVSERTVSELKTLLGSNDRSLLVCASTHAPEEQILIEAFKRIRQSSPDSRLLIAPRHPERFAEVWGMMSKIGLRCTRRSEAGAQALNADLILLDTIGELPAIYSFASVVFVGGSIAKNGGHNVLEPAVVGSCIVTGPYTFNFTAIIRKFVENDGLIQLPPLAEKDTVEELVDVFIRLLDEPARRQELGRKARAVVEKNIGATKRTLEIISPLLTISTQSLQNDPLTTAERVRPA